MRRALLLLIVWLVSLGGPAGAQPGGGDPERGERIFAAECAMCHGTDSAGMMGMHPSLRGAVERLTREGVEVTIRKGRNTMPPMPAFEGRLTDQTIADVIAYLDSLPAGPRNFGPEGGGRDGMGGMMGGSNTSGRGGSTAAWLMGALVVLVVVLVVLVVLPARQRRQAGVGDIDARSVLDRRYAAGHLTRDEYLERRRDLDT